LCVSSPLPPCGFPYKKEQEKGTFNQLIIEVDESTTLMVRLANNMTSPRTRGMARMEERNDEVEEIPVVTHETLTPPAVSVSNVFSKTTVFNWKLTKLPVNPNAVEVIRFETGVVGDYVTVLYPFEF
jgi:hypothetical protein